jgi:hypothetical protein
MAIKRSKLVNLLRSFLATGGEGMIENPIPFRDYCAKHEVTEDDAEDALKDLFFGTTKKPVSREPGDNPVGDNPVGDNPVTDISEK